MFQSLVSPKLVWELGDLAKDLSCGLYLVLPEPQFPQLYTGLTVPLGPRDALSETSLELGDSG